MTLEDTKILLAGRLGQRTDIDNMIYSEIRQAQQVLERTPPYPWFLFDQIILEWSGSPNFLPDNFIAMVDDVIYVIKATDDTTYYPQNFKVYGGYREHIQVGFGDRGRPENFSLDKGAIALAPYPDKSYSFYFTFYKQEPVLASPTSENEWTNKASDLLVAEAGWHVARNIRDAQRAAEFGQDRAEARRRISHESTARLESMRRAVIGSGEDAMLNQMTWESGHQ